MRGGVFYPSTPSLESYTPPPRAVLARLDRNENLFGPSPLVLEEIVSALTSAHLYPAREDFEELEEAVARYCGVSPENVVLTCGSDCALDLFSKCFVGPGDRVVVTPPTFSMYERVALTRGARVEKVPLTRERFELDLQAVSSRLKESKVLFLANPNNPTGNLLIDSRELEELLSFEGLVVLDEAYYEYSGVTFVELVRHYPNLVVLRTFSKAFGLAGLRVGYVVAAEETANAMRRIKLPYDVSLPAARAALAALRDLPYVRWVTLVTTREREKLGSRLRELGLRVYPSLANFLLISTERTSISASELASSLLERGVAVRDLSGVEGLTIYHARVTIGRPIDNALLLDALEEVLRAQR
ncbi:MAG: histidinol-phosphate transaminase [Fervidicoccaceae archaeon]